MELIKELEEREQVARDILSMKSEIVGLDAKRNKNREALRALSKLGEGNSKTWICSGNLFIKTKTSIAKAMIQADQTSLDATINEFRDQQKVQVDKLRKLEGKPVSSDPTPLSHSERNAFGQLLPTISDVEYFEK